MVKGFMSLLGFGVIFIVSVCDPRVNDTNAHTHDKRLAWNSTSHQRFLSLFRVLWSCWTKLCRSPWTLRLDCLSSSCWESPEKTDSSESLCHVRDKTIFTKSITVIITISGTVATAPWITAVRVQVHNTVAYNNLKLTNHKQLQYMFILYVCWIYIEHLY